MQNRRYIVVSPLCYVVIAAGLLVIPARWLLAWLFAVVIHEISHFLALQLLRIPIQSIRISIDGAKIETGYMCGWTEFFCASAGPIGALTLLFFARYIPCTVICVLVQTFFNLLPIYPFDGGRMLKCFTENVFSHRISVKIQVIAKYVTLGIMLIFACLLTFASDFGIFPLLLCTLLLVRTSVIKRPCKLQLKYSTIKQNQQEL